MLSAIFTARAQVVRSGSGERTSTYSPATYGAKCDGKADDTAAFTAMIGAIKAAETSATVLIPAGGCKIVSTLDLVEMPPTIFRGVGGENTVIAEGKGGISGSYFINYGIADDGPVFWVDGKRSRGKIATGYISFRDVGFMSATKNKGSAIRWDDYGGQNSMEHVAVWSFRNGITFGSTYQLAVSDSSFIYNGKAIFSEKGVAAGAWPVISGSTFRYNDSDIWLESGSDRLTLYGQSVVENSNNTSIYVRSSASAVIRDTHFEGNALKTGYRIDIADNGSYPMGLLYITGVNIATGAGTPASGVGTFIHETAPGKGVGSTVVEANYDATVAKQYVSVYVGKMVAGRSIYLVGNTVSSGSFDVAPDFRGELFAVNNLVNGAPWGVHASSLLQYAGTITTTAENSNSLAVRGLTTSDHCSFTPTNSQAARLREVYVVTENGSVTLRHPPDPGATFDISCTGR